MTKKQMRKTRMPEFKVLSGKTNPLNFGHPTIILVDFPKNQHETILESYVIIRPSNLEVSDCITNKLLLDDRPNLHDVRKPQYPDIPAAKVEFLETAKRAFIENGMNMPINQRDQPNEPTIDYTEVEKTELFRMLAKGAGHAHMTSIAKVTQSSELRDYLRNIVAIAPPPRAASDAYPEEPPQDQNHRP